MVWPTTFENYFEFYAKTVFVALKMGKIVKNLNFWKIGFKSCFWESISSHTHAFVLLYSMLWGKFFKKSGFSLKKLFFQIFDWSNRFFDQSKFCPKIYVSLCLVRLIKPDFRSIEDRISSFFKTVLWLFQKHPLQKVFQLFFSLQLGKDSLQFFVVFLQNFCKVFLPQGRYDYFNPPFCFIFMISCIFSCI